MLRIIIPKEDSLKYFDKIYSTTPLTKEIIATDHDVSTKSVRDWRLGKHSFPKSIADQVQAKWNISLPTSAKIIDTIKLKKHISKLGGIARCKIHGSPGTKSGRSLGGKRSIEVQSKSNNNFKALKQFPRLNPSGKLAEFIGIALGDGSLTPSQIKVYSDTNEKEYSYYVQQLMCELFGENPSMYFRSNVTEVCITGKQLVKKLTNKGLVVGSKIKHQIRIPRWIFKKQEWKYSVIRGLFDTDGCVFQDKHHINGRLYKSIGVTITTYSAPLKSDIIKILRQLNYHPSTTTKNQVMIRRKKEVVKFFRYCKPANQKHQRRYQLFTEKCRSG